MCFLDEVVSPKRSALAAYPVVLLILKVSFAYILGLFCLCTRSLLPIPWCTAFSLSKVSLCMAFEGF